jgi:hypothetical protein
MRIQRGVGYPTSDKCPPQKKAKCKNHQATDKLCGHGHTLLNSHAIRHKPFGTLREREPLRGPQSPRSGNPPSGLS